jgi:hypothetical protein
VLLSRPDYYTLQDEKLVKTFEGTWCFSLQRDLFSFTWLLRRIRGGNMLIKLRYLQGCDCMPSWVPRCKFLTPNTSVQVIHLLPIPWPLLTTILVNFVYCGHTPSSQSPEQPPESILPNLQLDLVRSSETQKQTCNRVFCKNPKDSHSKFVFITS